MIKQSFFTLLCLGLLGLSACSSEKKDMAAQSVETPAIEEAKADVDAVTKVADNDVVESDVARTGESERKEV